METSLIVTIVVLALIVLGLLSSVILVKYGYIRCESNVCLVGKTALVTGGSSGVGYELALALASRGCRVIIANRTVNEELRNAVIKETKNPNIELEYLDLMSFKSVRQFAERIKSYETKLDILVNNAGISKCTNQPTEDGLNAVLQVNHYSPFLLTHLLIDLLKKSDDARIIYNSSLMAFVHVYTSSSVTTSSIKDAFNRNFDYINSKFLNIVSTDMFAMKLKKYNITCNAFQPGVAKSKLLSVFEEHRKIYRIDDWIGTIFWRTLVILLQNDSHIAAQSGVDLAVSDKLKGVTGLFYGKYFPNLKPRLARNKGFCNKVWEASQNVVQLKANEIIQ